MEHVDQQSERIVNLLVYPCNRRKIGLISPFHRVNASLARAADVKQPKGRR
jgi:hypothetical protein